MSERNRIHVEVSERVLEEVDEMVEEGYYMSRSHAVRHALRREIERSDVEDEANTHVQQNAVKGGIGDV